ncbi:iron-containing alcohol dehydrogenase [Cryobacterium lyxosi]|uniref:Iron-containing alcohol dehydrogenase n=1 Tax=Cryobacterium lyxosi TaxID=1259228 RepID=A0A4R8ZJF8_9MICO|nr:iron-containing alcohol dehydrogenase [Cryobacterium lyxosi]TFD27655.1 iron-containing alcohol dehydrogenase [Cryobacterium lyxosi]
MSTFASITDPTDLDAIRAVIASTADAVDLVPLGIRALVISPQASFDLVPAVKSLVADGPTGTRRVAVLVDETAILRDGRDLKQQLCELLAEAFTIEIVVLGHGGQLHADEDALETATAAIKGYDCAVAIGSGTISDIGKVATDRLGGIPLVIVQTAASVDGFTDNVSVVLRNGVKRTIPSRWPDVVLADTTTIADAPVAMNTAGFGEVLSLYTAPADWELANRLGFDNSFRLTPRDFLLEFAGDPATWADGLAEGAPGVVLDLTRMLAIRGMGTGIAGTTACLSGVEHVVSHMLDMYAAAHNLPIGLHGAQVGVATQVASAAWDLLRRRVAEGGFTVRFPAASDLEQQVKRAFDVCDETGGRGEECWSDYARKIEAWNADPERMKGMVANAVSDGVAIAAAVPTPASLSAGLLAAGSPTTPGDLVEWVTPDIWRWAVANCLFMRDRFTVIDLLFLLGWWTPADVDVVIEQAFQAESEPTS